MYRIGIDEVGRGPLAGPVVVAAVALPPEIRLPKSLGELRDSKQMAPSARRAWEIWIRANLSFAISSSGPRMIERKNISACANACALTCYRKLSDEIGEARVRLDGGLFLGSKTQRAAYPKAITLPKADEDFPEVALASILAKEYRDRIMKKADKTYPEYGFSRHVGYGTKAHYEAIRKYGLTPLHRLTFLGSLGTIGPIPRT